MTIFVHIFKFGSQSGSSDPAIWVVFSKNYVYSTSKGLNWSLNIVLTYFFDVVKVQVIFIIIMKILKRGGKGGRTQSSKLRNWNIKILQFWGINQLLAAFKTIICVWYGWEKFPPFLEIKEDSTTQTRSPIIEIRRFFHFQ